MITKTYYDIGELINLVRALADASIEISSVSGRMYFRVSNFTHVDTSNEAYHLDMLEIDGEHSLRMSPENTDAAYKAIEKKIASGEWKKVEVPA